MKTYKKYANRKIYDTDASCYINIEDIIDDIKWGINVQIVSHPEGKDVTLEVLKEALKRVDMTKDEVIELLYKRG